MQLAKITKNLLPTVRDCFKSNWPNNVYSYGAIQHFIERFEKYPEWEDRVHFLKLKDDSVKDEAFAVVYGPYIYFDTLESAPYPKLEKLLYSLELKDYQIFSNIKDRYRPLVHNILRIRNMEKIFETSNKLLYYDIDEDYILSLKFEAPNGFYFDSLKTQDLNVLLSMIPSPTQRCIEYLDTVIKYNTTTGLYKDNGELVAWTVTHEFGIIGNTAVRSKYQGKHFGNIIVPKHGLTEVRKGRPIYGDVGHHNYKSFKLMTKFRAHLHDNISSFGFRKKPTPYYVPGWYHF